MLIIKAPIPIKYRPALGRGTDYFTERIRADYSLMESNLCPEDLIHMAALPPELYLAEGDSALFLQNNTRYNRQEVKLELVNQMLNRLPAGPSASFTWQDQVFVAAVLKKLGVTNVREFMEQVRQLWKETENVNRLIEIYWDRAWQLREIRKILPGKERVKDDAQTAAEREKEGDTPGSFLHQVIFDRLKTGAVYQEVLNFTQNSFRNGFIERAEMSLCEQSETARHILLQKLKNSVLEKKQPVNFQRMNFYELGGGGQGAHPAAPDGKQFARSALFQLAVNLYALRRNRSQSQRNSWFQFSASLYLSAENTWRRLEAFYQRYEINTEILNDYMEGVNRYLKQEITVLDRIFRSDTITGPEAEMPVTADESNSEAEEKFPAAERVYGIGREIPEKKRERKSGVQKAETEKKNDILLKKRLDEINRLNVQKREKELFLQKKEDHTEFRIDAKRAKEDVFRALEEPEKILRRYREEENLIQLRKEDKIRERYSIFTEETKQIFRLLEQYRKTPELLLENGVIRTDAGERLTRDIYFSERRREDWQAGKKEDGGSLPDQRERMAAGQGVSETPERGYAEGREAAEKESFERISLIHRESRLLETGEALEELRRKNKELQRSFEEHENSVRTKQMTKTDGESVINRMTHNRQENVEELVNRSLERQLGALTDQIYSRFEKKLDSGRRRRGI